MWFKTAISCGFLMPEICLKKHEKALWKYYKVQNKTSKEDKKFRQSEHVLLITWSPLKIYTYMMLIQWNSCIWTVDWNKFLILTKNWKDHTLKIIYNYPPKGRWIVVDIYRDAKCWGIYPPLFTDSEGDSSFSIYQIRWIKKRFFNFFFPNFREMTRHFSLRSQNSEYPQIFQVTEANQNARKLLSTDLVNTKQYYCICYSLWLTSFSSFSFYFLKKISLK